jgi:hypothetical protein
VRFGRSIFDWKIVPFAACGLFAATTKSADAVRASNPPASTRGMIARRQNPE